MLGGVGEKTGTGLAESSHEHKTIANNYLSLFYRQEKGVD